MLLESCQPCGCTCGAEDADSLKNVMVTNVLFHTVLRQSCAGASTRGCPVQAPGALGLNSRNRSALVCCTPWTHISSKYYRRIAEVDGRTLVLRRGRVREVRRRVRAWLCHAREERRYSTHMICNSEHVLPRHKLGFAIWSHSSWRGSVGPRRRRHAGGVARVLLP